MRLDFTAKKYSVNLFINFASLIPLPLWLLLIFISHMFVPLFRSNNFFHSGSPNTMMLSLNFISPFLFSLTNLKWYLNYVFNCLYITCLHKASQFVLSFCFLPGCSTCLQVHPVYYETYQILICQPSSQDVIYLPFWHVGFEYFQSLTKLPCIFLAHVLYAFVFNTCSICWLFKGFKSTLFCLPALGSTRNCTQCLEIYTFHTIPKLTSFTAEHFAIFQWTFLCMCDISGNHLVYSLNVFLSCYHPCFLVAPC